jgi:hypothetical protein
MQISPLGTMMTKLPAVGAAATILLTLLCAPDARAYCDEDCAYEVHEAAEERASEHAYAREEAAEEGYVRDDRRSERAPQREPQRDKRAARVKESETPAARQVPSVKRVAEPQPEPQTPAPEQRKSAPKSVASENSSIASETTQIAEDDTSGRKREVGCKTFFPSVGMTLSVPCD